MAMTESINEFLTPMTPFNCWAMLVAAIASFVFAWIWYGPLFGKKWQKLSGHKDKKMNMKKMVTTMGIAFIGTLLTSYVLAHTVAVWRPSTWSTAGVDKDSFHYGFFVAFFAWLGFFIPMSLSSVLWENKSWKLFLFNATFSFLNLQIMCVILAHWI